MWTMKGLLNLLCADTPAAKHLRDNVVFKVIPMLNPDGVVEGNYRCNLTGHDMNRTWESPSFREHPPIYCCKKMLLDLARKQRRSLLLYVDFHGHSRMFNSCTYGNSLSKCDKKYWPNSVRRSSREESENADAGGKDSNCDGLPDSDYTNDDSENDEILLGRAFTGKKVLESGLERLFPALLSMRSTDVFNLKQCTFNLTKEKLVAARAVFWKELSLAGSYTLECSFASSDRVKIVTCPYASCVFVHYKSCTTICFVRFSRVRFKGSVTLYQTLWALENMWWKLF